MTSFPSNKTGGLDIFQTDTTVPLDGPFNVVACFLCVLESTLTTNFFVATFGESYKNLFKTQAINDKRYAHAILSNRASYAGSPPVGSWSQECANKQTKINFHT